MQAGDEQTSQNLNRLHFWQLGRGALRTRNLQFRKPLANHTKLTHISSQKEAICCEVGKSLKIRGLNLAVGGTLLLYWCVPAANKFKG